MEEWAIKGKSRMGGLQRPEGIRRKHRAKRARLGRWRILVLWIVSGATLGVAAMLFDRALDQKNLPRMDPNDLSQVDDGRRLYAQACSSCHGASLKGESNWRERLADERMPAMPLDATGVAWRRSDKNLFAIIKAGPAAYPAGYSTDLPAFGQQLSDEEIAATIAYIKSVWPLEIRAQQARRSMAIWTKVVH